MCAGWSTRRVGTRFRRGLVSFGQAQHPWRPFFVSFFCVVACCIIELYKRHVGICISGNRKRCYYRLSCGRRGYIHRPVRGYRGTRSCTRSPYDGGNASSPARISDTPASCSSRGGEGSRVRRRCGADLGAGSCNRRAEGCWLGPATGSAAS